MHGVRAAIRTHRPLLIVVAALWATLAVLLMVSLHQNRGHLIYALDDAYIHMAVARNVVAHGVWGVTRYGFSSSTSSLLWPVLLAGSFALVGPYDAIPLILNAILATLLIGVAYAALRRKLPSSLYLTAVLLSILVLASVPALVFTGMEHVLQLVLTLSFAILCAEELASHRRQWSSRTTGLFILAPFLASTRYEGLFVVGAGCVLFILRRRWRRALGLGVVAIAPVLIYAAISTNQGWLWLPNSVMLKGNVTQIGIDLFVGHALAAMRYDPQIVLLVMLAIGFYGWRRWDGHDPWEVDGVLLLLFASTASVQVPLTWAMAPFGRYVAVLVALGIMALAPPLYRTVVESASTPARRARWVSTVATCAALVMLLIARGIPDLALLPRATTNIYEQQYQMGRFLAKFYEHGAVAANDIGLIDWEADLHLLDLWGLASVEVARAKLAGTYNTQDIARLAGEHHVHVAIVYDAWFDHLHPAQIPSQWTRVGEWTIGENVVAGDKTVSFYAVEPEETARLLTSLRQFAPMLPATVRQSGLYCDGGAGCAAGHPRPAAHAPPEPQAGAG